MRSDAETVDQYIEELEGERKEIIVWLREVLDRAVSGLEESMEYGMPTYKKGEDYYAFASQKQHVSFYVNDAELLKEYSQDLGKVSLGKNCIRFRHLKDIDQDMMKALLVRSSK